MRKSFVVRQLRDPDYVAMVCWGPREVAASLGRPATSSTKRSCQRHTHGLADARRAVDRLDGLAVCSRRHDPRPPHHLRRRVAIRNQAREPRVPRTPSSDPGYAAASLNSIDEICWRLRVRSARDASRRTSLRVAASLVSTSPR